MGSLIDPAKLTESGERCIARLTELVELRLPAPQLITAIGTVVEVHVTRILTQLVEQSGIQEGQLGNAMLNHIGEEMTRTWPDRAKWLKNGFSIQYKGRAAAQDFDVLIELRNVVVHGDGAASEQQQRQSMTMLSTMRKLLSDRLDVEFRGHAKFAHTSGPLAMDIARRFVADLDQLVLQSFPYPDHTRKTEP